MSATTSTNLPENSLLRACPGVAAEWHPTKNLPLALEEITAGSGRKVWWQCDRGHEWKSVVGNRVKFYPNRHGCPYCSGRLPIPGETDLATLYPEISKQWSNKNTISPSDVTASSEKKVWWRCHEGHEWDAPVRNRTKLGTGCPVCAGKKILVGYNDLATLKPELAQEWSARNTKKPQEFTISSGKKVWWQCKEGHEWEASPAKRNRGDGCPYCSGHRLATGYNDLATKYPEVAKQWSAKNTIPASQVSAHNGESFIWECAKGHEWTSTVFDRTRGNGCPVCGNKKVQQGYNDLARSHPDVAREWSSKNELLPTEVTFGSSKYAWWECDRGHEWYAAVSSRTQGSGCPTCANIVSSAEQELTEWVTSLLSGYDIRTSDRQLISPKELDIYIPAKNIAIEFNGLRWHTEEFSRGKEYHYDKWRRCADQGVQLIQVWEDQWRDKKDIVKRMLAAKLGVSQEKRVHGRKTELILLDKEEAMDFLDSHHIQGFASGSHYLGLSYEDVTVAVMVLKKQGEDMLLSRYATSAHVLGGQSKLVRWAERNLNYRNLITFADLEVSNGNLYEQTGFVKDKALPPDYKYLYQGERRHKFGFRLERFKNDPNLLYEEGLSERELALLNKIPRLWDSGKIRYQKPRPTVL